MQLETTDSVRSDNPQLAELLGRIDALIAQVGGLSAQNASLNEQVRLLLARIAELEGRPGHPPPSEPPKTSQNSSLPPSKGFKANRPEPGTPKPPRKGRPGTARALCPDPDQVRNVYAETCTRCGAALDARHQSTAHAYDHIELPVIKPVTTRVVLHAATCACCPKPVVAPAPADMAPKSPFGPRISATVTYLHATQMVSYSRLTQMLADVFGLSLSQGAIANMLRRAALPFAAVADGIAEIVRHSPVIASDETSARVAGKTWWQWTFGAAHAVYHQIVPTRGKVVPTEFLAGHVPHVWLSDRLASQCGHGVRHQVCLAHLIREAQYAIEAGDTLFAARFKRFLQVACVVGARRPQLSDAGLAFWAAVLERELARILVLKASASAGSKLRASVAVGAREKLLVFMTRRDVEPTNNESERELRPSVIMRKVTGGFRSVWGAESYGDIRSIVATGRRRGRSPLEAIAAALSGHLLPRPVAETASG